MASCISSGTKSYLLDKYARFTSTKNPQGLSCTAVDNGEWKQYCSREGQGSFQITLIQQKHFMVSSGAQIHESFSLVNASEWLKTVCKGDSLLFFLKMNDETRRFRVKFANTGIKTGSDNCLEFVKTVSMLFPVKVIPVDEGGLSQFAEDAQLFGTPPVRRPETSQDIAVGNETSNTGASIPEISRQVLSSADTRIPTNLPTSDLKTLVKLCLTDPGFPDFVGKVEQELKILTSQK